MTELKPLKRLLAKAKAVAETVHAKYETRLLGPLKRLLDKAKAVAETAHTKYGIHPGIFLVLYLGTWPPYAFGVVKTLWALGHKEVMGTLLWASYTFIIFILPYAYILVWGKNLPRWVRPGVILVLLILIGWRAYGIIAN